MDLLLARVLELGARHARAGEFSVRAFLNGKLDLAQAEAVADLIEADSAAAVLAARRTMSGAFSDRIGALVGGLVALRVLVEATIDFSDEEDVGGIGPEEIGGRVAPLGAELAAIRRDAEQGRLLRDGVRVAIVGRPNVGKSSLLNRLCGHDAAIVTPVPGTTRDVLRERITLEGLPVHLLDTAGLRETADEVEAIGVERAGAAAREADVVLHVIDDGAGWTDEDAALARALGGEGAMIVVRNKVDLTGRAAGLAREEANGSVRVSALRGEGMEALVEALRAAVGAQAGPEGIFSARRRHLEALDEAAAALAECEGAAAAGLELAAEELRLAQRSLGRITGEFTTEDLLGEIFASFCIGK
jgi:tRNA modification GTPase